MTVWRRERLQGNMTRTRKKTRIIMEHIVNQQKKIDHMFQTHLIKHFKHIQE